MLLVAAPLQDARGRRADAEPSAHARGVAAAGRQPSQANMHAPCMQVTELQGGIPRRLLEGRILTA